jgi:beta-lactamase regulating signal transducer with metallopeptidase domain
MGLNAAVGLIIDGILNMRGLLWDGIPAISQTAGTILLTAIWQSAVLAACLAVCIRLVPRANAAHRFLIWTAGFVAAICLPFLPLMTHFVARTVAISSGSFAHEVATPLLRLDLRWSILLAYLWAAASLYRAVDLVIHSLRLRQLWKSASPVEADARYALSLTIPGRKPAELCTTNQLERPSVIGFLSPRILIPDWLFARLTPGELDQILLHETEHLRRGDDWTNLLQKLSLIVFPLNPVLLWMERQLCMEREMACDEGVVRVTNAPRAYAACLASLAERGMQHRTEAASLGALSLGAWHRRPELVRRVHSVLLHRKALGPLGSRSLLAVLGCSLIFGSVELSRCPQLIAFTPASVTDTAVAHLPVVREAGSPRMINAAYIEKLPNRAAGIFPKPYLTQLKTVHPMKVPPVSIATRQTAQLHVAPKQSAQRVSQELAIASPQLESLKADELPESEADSAQGQGWLVLTTWEQVDVADQAYVQSSEKENVTAQPPRQMTVTRLIFRILPSSSESKFPAVSPVRAGWLIIQL